VASSSPRAFEYCDEKQRLVDAYAFATADYNRAVQVLQRRRGVMSKTEYERLRESFQNRLAQAASRLETNWSATRPTTAAEKEARKMVSVGQGSFPEHQSGCCGGRRTTLNAPVLVGFHSAAHVAPRIAFDDAWAGRVTRHSSRRRSRRLQSSESQLSPIA
jgi:hypothetical protein